MTRAIGSPASCGAFATAGGSVLVALRACRCDLCGDEFIPDVPRRRRCFLCAPRFIDGASNPGATAGHPSLDVSSSTSGRRGDEPRRPILSGDRA